MRPGHRESSRSLRGARWWSSLAPVTRGTCGRPRPAPQPPGSPAPRCEVSPGSCRLLPVRLSGETTREWGLRRCRRGCPLLGLTLCGRATSSRAPPPQGSLFSSPPKHKPWAPRCGGGSRGFLGRRGSPSLGLDPPCARTGLTLSVPSPRRATCSSVARARCAPPSAQPWGSVGAAGACGAPGPLRAVDGARGRWRGGRCTEGCLRGRGPRRSIWTASCS